MRRFEGLTVLISGATGGFGAASAKRFAEEGARLVLTDIDTAKLEALVASLDADVGTLAGDISQEETSRDLVALALDQFGRLDVALNNAGIVHPFHRLDQTPSDLARRVLEVDLLGVFFAMKHQLPAMAAQHKASGRGGAIVNIASVAGIAGAPKLGVYAAAKHGVVGLTRSAAAEFAARGVRVNAVCPAFSRTKMVTTAIGVGNAEAEAELTRGVPMKRVAEVDEIVEVILFAADPRNSFMTGQAIAADGGITAI